MIVWNNNIVTISITNAYLGNTHKESCCWPLLCRPWELWTESKLPAKRASKLSVCTFLFAHSTSDPAQMGLYSKGYWLNEFPQYPDLYHSTEWWSYNSVVSRAWYLDMLSLFRVRHGLCSSKCLGCHITDAPYVFCWMSWRWVISHPQV